MNLFAGFAATNSCYMRGSLPQRTRSSGGDLMQVAARYFIRSWILARASRAQSSSNRPPGAPLTPIAPIATPPALMVTPPTP